MSNSPLTVVDIIRHGEPVGGIMYRGQKDDPLSEKGWQQMRDAVSDHKPWDIIVSSPMIRCAAFAEELADRHQISLVFDERIKEIGWGDWEGKAPAELNAIDPQTVARALNEPHVHRPANAESLHDFRQRVTRAWQDITSTHNEKHILIVAHAGVIRAVLTYILNTPVENMFRIHVPNASITRIHIENTLKHPFPKLIFHGGKL